MDRNQDLRLIILFFDNYFGFDLVHLMEKLLDVFGWHRHSYKRTRSERGDEQYLAQFIFHGYTTFRVQTQRSLEASS